LKKIFYIIIFLISSELLAQIDNLTIVDTLVVGAGNKVILNNNNAIPNSVRVTTSEKMFGSEEINFDAISNSITFNDIGTSTGIDTVFVFYKTYPDLFKNSYRKRALIYYDSPQEKDSLVISQLLHSKPITSESIFGKDMVKSGSITRGFTVGTTKDFSLNSGLNLSLSGKLSDDIEIIAALTDENTPIQPDGNTETLEELDKVFIQVKHSNVIGTFGDIDYKIKSGEFGKLQRKLKGLQTDLNYGNSTASFVFATQRGKFTNKSFGGNDGVQGPYRLTGSNNERNIIIIAGSERVYLDGVELQRGENNDYSIDYSTAEIFFTPKRVITSASRISVDFEYSDRQYKRDYFGAGVGTKLFNDALKVSFNYFSESDEHESPLDLILDENDKQILQNAGDNVQNAAVSGVRIPEPDSLGVIHGSYTAVDSLIMGVPFTYYRYSPESINSVYNVSFSYVGEGKGDYRRERLGEYKFAGVGQGGYLPLRFLPLPAFRQMGNMIFDFNPIDNMNIKIELAGSIFDENRFSDIDDDDNEGFARKLEAQYSLDNLSVAGINLRKIDISLKDRFIDTNFRSLDRIDEVEFGRDYNIGLDVKGNEHLTELQIKSKLSNQFDLNTFWGRYRKGNVFSSDRYKFFASFVEQNKYALKYDIDYVTTSDANFVSNWVKQNSDANYYIGDIKLIVDFLYENKLSSFANSDSLHQNSLRYFQIKPGVQLISGKSFELYANYTIREESFPISGEMKLASVSNAQGFTALYRDNKYSSNLNLSILNKKFENDFKKLGFADNETVLIKTQHNFNFGKRLVKGAIFYEAVTEKSSRFERIFIRVPQGAGNYSYLGDINKNGIADENEFEPTLYDGDYISTTYPTDELFPVVDLKFNTRWSFDLSQYFKENAAFSKLLRALSSETSWRIDENSKESDISKIYFLNLSSFLSDSTTLRGSNTFTQDLFYDKNKRDFSLRLRYIQKKYLNNFSAGIEEGYLRERSIKLRIGLIKEILNQTEYINKTDLVSAQLNSNRNRELISDELTTEFSYRPYPRWEVGLKFVAGTTNDSYPQTPTEITFNSQELRINYSFFTKGRIRGELERNEYLVNTEENYIPFEITKGNAVGKNYILRIIFEYKIGTNLQTTVNYMGRFHGSGRVLNTFRAEARAFF